MADLMYDDGHDDGNSNDGDDVSMNDFDGEASDSSDDQSENSVNSDGDDSDAEMAEMDDAEREANAQTRVQRRIDEKNLELEIRQMECLRRIRCMSYGPYHEVAASISLLNLIRAQKIAVRKTAPGISLHATVTDMAAKKPYLFRNMTVEQFAEQRTMSVPAKEFISMKAGGHAVTPTENSLFRSSMA